MASRMAEFLGDVRPELALALGGIVILFVALFTPQRLQAWAGGLSIVVLTAAGYFTGLDITGAPRFTFFETYIVDGLGRWVTLTLLIVAILTVALSVDWFRTDTRHGEYYTILLFGTLGGVLLTGTADLMEFVIAILVSSVTGFTLAAYHRKSRAASEAGIKYFLLGALANGATVYGVALLFGLGASTTFTDLRVSLVGADQLALVVGFGMVMIGVAFKLGAVPVHPWTPDVAEGAPAPVAAFLMVVGKLGGFIFLARFVMMLPETDLGWRMLAALMATATMTVGNLAALWQDDVRRLLGWSSVSQAGYGLMAIVALGRSDLALSSLLMFLVAYAFGTMAVFGVVVTLRGLTDRESYNGLASSHPWLAAALVIGFLSFVGIPPLGGFAAKLLLMGAVIDAGYAWLAVVAVINSVISLFYYLRVIGPAYLREEETPRPVIGRMPGWAVAVATVAVIAIGLAAQPLIDAWQLLEVMPS